MRVGIALSIPQLTAKTYLSMYANVLCRYCFPSFIDLPCNAS